MSTSKAIRIWSVLEMPDGTFRVCEAASPSGNLEYRDGAWQVDDRDPVALEARMTESWPLMLALFLPILPVSMTREILLCVEVEIRG